MRRQRDVNLNKPGQYLNEFLEHRSLKAQEFTT